MLRVVLAAFIVAGGLVAGAAPASACTVRSDVTIPARTFHIEAEWSKPAYRIGEKAVIDITVTRPSHQDPVTDEGNDLPVEPPVAEPADGVTVGVGIYIGDVYLSGGGITDAEGHLVAKVKIQNYAKPGTASATLFGYKRYLTETRCVYVQEFGFIRMTDAFKVTR